MSLRTYAETQGDRPAIILGNGDRVETFGELELRSRQLAALLRARGLEHGGCVAALMDNADPWFLDLYWACQRAGLFFTPVNWHLQEDEIQYIVDNSDADALFASGQFADVAARVGPQCPKLKLRVATSGEIEGFDEIDAALGELGDDPALDDEREGSLMLYSSGTTGRPKGVRRGLPDLEAGAPAMVGLAKIFLGMFGIDETDRYLCPAPLYHAAPIMFTTNHLRLGASVVVLPRFEPELCIKAIQDQQVTSSQWVPTHFRRLLQLPEDVRKQYDVSSLKVAVHAAAPCPIPVKQAMIEWWGNCILEYYAGTEGGGTMIRADEWMTHKGSVGRHWSGGKVWILDDDGEEVTAPNTEGAVYFEAPAQGRFEYHKDGEKTAKTYRGDLFTIGDIGYLDDEGYLYLTDRQSNMIISGGVNIYPQETENFLIVHEKVDDVAVIGVPNEEMGEEVKAVVIPAAGVAPGPELERELIDYCRAGIAHYKAPRSIDFVDELPRTETGKMAKRKLRDRYWEGKGGVIG